MRLLFLGDLSATGFGTVTTDLGRALLERGVDVRFLSQNDVETLPEPFLSRTLDASTFVSGPYFGVEDMNRTIPALIAGECSAPLANGEPYGDWKPDAVFLLGDFAAVRYLVGPYVEAFQSVPSYHYVPIEGVDLPPSWKGVWDVVTPIAMSKFGQAQIAKVTGKVPPLMYHGVDTEAFHPVSPDNPIHIEGADRNVTLKTREACRAFFTKGPVDPSRVWVLRTDRHMPRKRHNLLIRAMVPVMERNPKVDLIFHCNPLDQGGYLPDTISKLPEGVRDRVITTKLFGLPRTVLCALYNAADVYASVSAEGFGLTIAEAIACGTPAVGLDYSAVPEVIGPAGNVVAVDYLFDNEYDHMWAQPDPVVFGNAVEWMVRHPARRRELGSHGPSHVRKNFSWAEAARTFLDVASPMEVAA